MKKVVSGLLLAALGVAVVSGAQAAEPKKVTILQPTNAVDIRNAPWMVAQELGWFAEKGITIDLQPTKGATIVVQQIMSGGFNYGMAAPEPAVIAYSKGAPLSYVFASTTRSPFPLATLEASPYKELKDFRGTTIGIFSMTGVQFFTTQSVLRSAGLKYPEDYSMVEVGNGAAALKALQDGRVSAVVTSIMNYGGFESRGVKLRYLSSPESEKILAWGLLTTKAHVEANRDEVINVAQGFLKGSLFCRMNADACIRIFLKHYPAMRTPGVSEEQTFADQRRILEKYLEYSPQLANRPWGWADAEATAALVNYMVAGDQLPKPVDPAGLYSNALLEKINAFDLDVIKKAAANAK
jgi:NitT/TauT family transport system substrate-binding protein